VLKMKEEQTNGADAPVNNKPTADNSDTFTEDGQSKEQEANTENQPSETTESELERLTNELSEVKDKHLRLYSEFENYRRRTSRERLELIGSANADLIQTLLPVLDDFERAMEAAEKSGSGAEYQGIHLIYQKLLKELQNKGLKAMEDLEGEPFDAEVHEAISQTPAARRKLKNHIVHVVEKGYYLNDKVLRYAKVVIGT